MSPQDGYTQFGLIKNLPDLHLVRWNVSHISSISSNRLRRHSWLEVMDVYMIRPDWLDRLPPPTLIKRACSLSLESNSTGTPCSWIFMALSSICWISGKEHDGVTMMKIVIKIILKTYINQTAVDAYICNSRALGVYLLCVCTAPFFPPLSRYIKSTFFCLPKMHISR